MPVTNTPGIPSVAQITSSYQPTTKTGVSENAIAGNFAWLKYPRIDNFGSIDPQGNYWKPDSNVLTPPGFPITNLYPGTVTSVQRTSYGQTVVTVKLDNAINPLATHVFYEHLHDANVGIGQHIASGSLIGHANYKGEGANVGVGLYSGDIYGTGSSWQTLQNDLAPGGQGLLNPTKILDSFKNGTATQYSTSQSVNPPSCGLLDIGCWATTIGEHIAVFLIAIIMIILGFYLLAEKEVTGLAKKAIP
jgi:hypothetical protein